MRTFTDTAGRVWDLTVTTLTVKHVKDATDILLTGLFQNDLKLLAELQSDICLFGRVLWAVCSKQATQSGVDEDSFLSAIAGDALANSLEEFARANADFLPYQDQREAIHQMLDMMIAIDREVKSAGAAEMEEETSKVDPKSVAKDYISFALSTPGSSDNHLGTTALAN